METLTRINPLLTKGLRERCRWKHLLSWGLIAHTLMMFLAILIYQVQVEQELASPRDAARWVIIPVLIIQCVLLIFFGTGAVAGTISNERDDRQLDYQRMTPMRPSSKILGYLYGVPLREYILSASMLPYLIWAMWLGDFPVWPMVQFYFVLMIAVALYHMTGMVAGVVSNKPRWSAYVAQAFVLALYFVLPNLSYVGFTAFEFLTIRPVLLGLIWEEVSRNPTAASALFAASVNEVDAYRPVPLFNVMVHPIVYSVLVQGFLLATMFLVVHRNWLNEHCNQFSKRMGYTVFAGIALFTLGSLWPVIRDAESMRAFLANLPWGGEMDGPWLTLMFITNILCLTLAAFGVFTVWQCTPGRHKARQAIRQAIRDGRKRPRWNEDGASAVWVALGIGLMAAATALSLAHQAASSGQFFVEPPAFGRTLMAPAVVFCTVLFAHAVWERLSRRAAIVGLFLLWVLPGMLAILLLIPEFFAPAAYISLLSPPSAIGATVYATLSNGVYNPEIMANFQDVRDEAPFSPEGLAATATVGYAILAVGSQVALAQWKRRLRAGVLEQPAVISQAA